MVLENPKLRLVLDYDHGVRITDLVVNGQKVIGSADGIFTSVSANGVTYSSLHVKSVPFLTRAGNRTEVSGIVYGDSSLTIREKWIFTTTDQAIKWDIERSFSKPAEVQESTVPVFNFDNVDTWEGAYQGYGGLAWFYLFDQKACTYGVHTTSSSFWNSKSGNGLDVSVEAPGKAVAMKYTRTEEDRLACAITVSDKEMLPKYDSGTNRRRFIRGGADVWAPFAVTPGKSTQRIVLRYFDFNERYGRGSFAGINGAQVSAVLNTIARVGVIDSLYFGGNSWHTPYGPICLHEQYIAQLGLGIDDPAYLKGYQSCLDNYLAHAIKPDGRVFARWAYTNEDMMRGQVNKYGFYEAQWGFLMDSNPDLVSNVSDLYDLTGDKHWVKRQQARCEKALDWILKRDSNGNGLVEVMTDSEKEKRGSDWIDIVWASYENAFVNAKLYHALVKWAAIERQLDNNDKAAFYESFAARLKASFNKPVTEGGFWDEEGKCYVHWLDKDKSAHGRNMVTPVNFMAIAYGICDDDARRKSILDQIETQMEKENLFSWPLAMTSYAPGEAKASQFPFPAYENGDIFLSWGSIGVKAYASYNPALAVKYVKNVLEQYSKDGLAFQRYGRVKQDGLGDDILSGNSLTIVGLYQAIYGINPLYNRFYLDPHITPELAGTELIYRYRGERLTIDLDSNRYAVSDKRFRVVCAKAFGFSDTGRQMCFFAGDAAAASLQVTSVGAAARVTSAAPLTVEVGNWTPDRMEWVRTGAGPLVYRVCGLKPLAGYLLLINGGTVKKVRSNEEGELVINRPGSSVSERIEISKSTK